MWKLLRNLLLAAVLVAGVLKLLAWYEVGQDAQRLTNALAPFAQVTYGSISAGLDGSVRLNNVSVAIKRDKSPYKAEQVVLELPSVFWLLKHALLSEDAWPARFGIAVQGLKIPAELRTDQHWFDSTTLVPFETAGCAAAEFSAADYRKMDVSPGETRQHADIRYDAAARTADVTLVLTAPETASLTIEAGLRQFEPKMLQSADAVKKLHVEQLAVDFSDSGFLKRRNQFCAQRAGIGPGQFAEQHVAAVQELLQQQGVEPSAEVQKLYRRLVDNGGHVSVLSLPSASFLAGSWWSSSREDLLRQLNVTARYEEAPPVMFRLGFSAPPEAPDAGAVAEGAASPVSPGPGSAAGPVSPPSATPSPIAAPPPTTPAPVAGAMSPGVPTTAAITPKPIVVNPPVPGTPVQQPVQVPAPLAITSKLSTTAPSATPPSTPASGTTAPNAATSSSATQNTAANSKRPTANGLEEVDRAMARMPPPPKRDAATAPEFLPSQAPPPPGSTLALVWKPTIERLPPAVAPHHDYDVIEFAGLSSNHGRFVRLITEGGKKVEGYVVSADEEAVKLRVGGESGGDAEFLVPRTRVHEVQLLKRSSPPA